MFSWIAAESCKGSCVPSDPTSDTVKVSPVDIDRKQQECERREGELRETQRKRAEEAECAARQRLERDQEQLEREREEERMRFERKRQEEEEETARIEEERREMARFEATERVRQEEEETRQQLQVWLKKNKYASVNSKKTKMMMARYPLHDAVAQRDAVTVRLLLRFGADLTLKNTSGRTAQEVAKNTKGCDDVLAAFVCQPQVKRGGA